MLARLVALLAIAGTAIAVIAHGPGRPGTVVSYLSDPFTAN